MIRRLAMWLFGKKSDLGPLYSDFAHAGPAHEHLAERGEREERMLAEIDEHLERARAALQSAERRRTERKPT